jgi:hypothetical protein
MHYFQDLPMHLYNIAECANYFIYIQLRKLPFNLRLVFNGHIKSTHYYVLPASISVYTVKLINFRVRVKLYETFHLKTTNILKYLVTMKLRRSVL